ncbi:MAG: hypothetical protein AAGA92_13270 [Planctomycetota bacterium]
MDSSQSVNYRDDACPNSAWPTGQGALETGSIHADQGRIDWGVAAAAGEGLSATLTVFFVLLPEVFSAIGASPRLMALCWTGGTMAIVFLAAVLLAVFFRLAVFGLPRLIGAIYQTLLPDFGALQPLGAGGTRGCE